MAKTHLAVAIGREVIVAGYTVLFVLAMTLVATLAKAHAEGRLEEQLELAPRFDRTLRRNHGGLGICLSTCLCLTTR